MCAYRTDGWMGPGWAGGGVGGLEEREVELDGCVVQETGGSGREVDRGQTPRKALLSVLGGPSPETGTSRKTVSGRRSPHAVCQAVACLLGSAGLGRSPPQMGKLARAAWYCT